MKKKKSVIKLLIACFLQFLSRRFKGIVKKYRLLRNIIESYIDLHTETEFIDLAPVDEIEKGDEYFKALDWALNNKNIHNIAMTGPYGSGKSSIIQAYLKKRPSTKHISISLASFVEEKEDRDGKVISSLVDFDETKIEEGVLKQLFYKVNYKKIPHSRYRKLHGIDGKSISIKILSIFAIIIFAVYFFAPDKFEKLKNIMNGSANKYRVDIVIPWIIAAIFLIIGCSLVSYLFWWMSSKYKIKELKIADKASVTTESENSASIFNKNIDEIMYFFEMTKFNTVFIEDLDRFESAEIFIKLRELNTLLNNYEVIKRRIVFVYAVRDDVFSDKDRTKFFDFIIPVIPIINSTNSGEILLKRISESKLNSEISPEYITKVAPYIDDMRILTNIYNEFVIYKNTLSDLQGLKLKDEQMLSLMILKNLYPKDFAKLQNEDGIVKIAFNDKRAFVNRQHNIFEKDRKELQNILESIEHDTLRSIRELKAAMFYYLSGEMGTVRYINIEGQTYHFNDIMEDEFDLHKLSESRMTIYYIYGNANIQNRSLNNLNDISEDGISYLERWEYLKESTPAKKEQLKKKIEALDMMEHEINSLTLQQLISKFNVKEALSENVLQNKLLVFMLRNGYIDETYANYINYFHPNSITKDDMNFILAVRNHEAKDYSYHLTKVEQIVERLLDYEFKQKEIYNFELLDYLLQNDTYSEKCLNFVRQLSDRSKESKEFIDQYIDKAQNILIFIKVISSLYLEFWFDIYKNNVMTDDRILNYFKLIVSYANVEDIIKMNILEADDVLYIIDDDEDNLEGYGAIYAYFVDTPDILQKLNDIDINKIKRIIEEMYICFYELNCDGVSNELLDFIFSKQYYCINPSMIENIIKNKNPDRIQDLQTSNYTEILNTKYEPLISYIDDNFEEYVKNVCLAIDSNTFETIDSVICMLRKIIKNQKLCLELIKKENVILTDLNQCCVDKIEESKKEILTIWNSFISLGKVLVSWDNVVIYWNNFNLTSELLTFIENNMKVLSESDDCDIVPCELIKAILIENMNLNAYKQFVENFTLEEFDIDFAEFSKEQMEILIKCKYFDLTPEHFSEIKENFPELHILYALYHKKTLLADLHEYVLDIHDLDALIISYELTEDEKIKILSLINLEEMSLQIAQVIKKIKLGINKKIVDESWKLLPQKDKYELLINQIHVYSNDELASRFEELGGPYVQLVDRSRVHKITLIDTEYNRKLMDHLLNVDYLTSREYEAKEQQDKTTFKKYVENIIVGRVKKKL